MKHTNRRRDSSAGGRYGGRGALSRNAAANVEKPRIMFPTISRRSLFTGTIKSCRTLCKYINYNCLFARILLYLPYTLKKYVITTKKNQQWKHQPFFSCSYATHAVKLIKDPLQAC